MQGSKGGSVLGVSFKDKCSQGTSMQGELQLHFALHISAVKACCAPVHGK